MPKPGDRVIIDGTKLGAVRREGTLVEQIGTLIKVRWADGGESLLTPGAGSVRYETGKAKSNGKAAPKKASASKPAAASKKAAAKATAKPAKAPAKGAVKSGKATAKAGSTKKKAAKKR